MLYPNATNNAEPIGTEITTCKATSNVLSALVVWLTNKMVDTQRGLFRTTLDDSRLKRRGELTQRVQQLLPGNTPEQVERDVRFLAGAAPQPDPDHEQLLLQHLADPTDVTWKRIYADFCADRDDPREAPLRAEVAAIDAGISPQAVCGILEAQRHLGVMFTPDHLDALGRMPFSPETLRECRGTHVLVPGAPLSLREIHWLSFDHNQEMRLFDDPCVHEKVGVRWHLLRKEPVPESYNNTLSQQTFLLTTEEEVPRACEMAYMIVLHWMAHGERLLSRESVRCRDRTSDGHGIHLGSFDTVGFHFDRNILILRHPNLGLASSRKS